MIKIQSKFVMMWLLMMVAMVASAQTKSKRLVTGTIVDFVTLEATRVDSVDILAPDSTTLVSRGRAYTEYKYNSTYSNAKVVSEFTAEVPDTGTYVIRVSARDYHPLLHRFTVKAGKRQFETNIGRLELRRKARPAESDVELKEVVVNATKLKFYFDGDTLVYDASAFVTDQSFTLVDALKKMPGIDVRDDGTIYTQGRKVDALLLNGKDFFNKDRKTLLDNLPAFMVKDVKIYDKTQDSLSLIKREREFHGFVMDVKLKKEYATSTVGTVDVGYGTNNRYQGKLFGMRFNGLGRVSISANVNNTNDMELQTSEYSYNYGYSRLGDNGEQKNTKSHIGYNFDHSKGLYSLEGECNVNYTDGHVSDLTNSQSFYTTGDIFSRSSSFMRSYYSEITSRHTWNFLSNTFWDFTLSPSIRIEHTHGNSESLNADFNADVMNTMGDAWQDSLRAKDLSPTLLKHGISRSFDNSRDCQDAISSSLRLNKDFKFKNSNDAIHLEMEGNTSQSHSSKFSQYNIDQIADGNKNTWENKYTHDRQSRTELREKLSYDYKLFPRTTVSAIYEHTNESQEASDNLYLLHQLEGWAKGTEHLLGELPDAQALASVIDGPNSERTKETRSKDEVIVGYRYEPKNDEKKVGFKANFSLPIRHESLHYMGEQADETVRTSLYRPKWDVELRYRLSGASFNLSYRDEYETPYLRNMIDVRNTSTPLYVTLGNPDLKGSHQQSINLSTNFSKGLGWHYAYLYWMNNRHSQSSANIYDRQTGVTTNKTINVEGQSYLGGHIQNEIGLDKRHRSEIINQLEVNAQTSMSMQTAESFDDLQLYKVHSQNIDETLTFRQQLFNYKLTLSGSGNVRYNHSTSPMESFQRISAWDYGLQFKVEAELPKRFEIESSFRSISRRGYNYAQMNDDEYLWNITAKKHIKDITLQLDVFDLLNQRKATQYYVSSTGRTETFQNTLRSYAMFHVIWKISKKPKKQE